MVGLCLPYILCEVLGNGMSEELPQLSKDTMEQWQRIQEYIEPEMLSIINSLLKCAFFDGKKAGVEYLHTKLQEEMKKNAN